MRRRAGDLGAIFIERILERVGLHQHVDLPFAVPDFFLEFIPQIADRFWFSFHDELDHFLQEDALEFFESARFKRAALDDHFAIFREERVILRLVAEHGVELFVELDFDSRRQFLRQTSQRSIVCSGDVLGWLCGSAAAWDRRSTDRRHEINSVGIDFDHLRAARLNQSIIFLSKSRPIWVTRAAASKSAKCPCAKPR